MKPVIIFISDSILDSSRAFNFLVKSFKISPAKFSYLKKKYFIPAKKGKLTKKQLLSKLSKEWEISRKDLLKILIKSGKLMRIKKKNFRNAMKLKKQGYRVVIVGNTASLFVFLSAIEKNTYKKFSRAFLSYKLKTLETEPKFYKIIFKKLKVKPTEVIIYNDNKKLNNVLKKTKCQIKNI